ncbi:hypothetical protein [Streptomyces sp. NPDC006552]|uniref:hypothetical protein n=1 Tax=Streptomyces sp. NPDC006552 TaxID=3157179 RepID=UPI0033BC68FF
MSRVRKALVAGAVAAVCLAGVSTLAFADSGTSPLASTRAAGDTPPLTVEDYQHPGAGQILQDTGMTLKKGDGHIFYAPCDNSPEQIRVWTRLNDKDGRYCFTSTAKTGFLTLEVPEVYGIETAARAVHAELTADGKSQEVDVAKGEFKGVGEGTSGAPTVLLEIQVTG